MAHSLGVNVLQAVHQLQEVCAADVWLEGAALCDVFEEVTPSTMLDDDAEAFILLVELSRISGVFPH